MKDNELQIRTHRAVLKTAIKLLESNRKKKIDAKISRFEMDTMLNHIIVLSDYAYVSDGRMAIKLLGNVRMIPGLYDFKNIEAVKKLLLKKNDSSDVSFAIVKKDCGIEPYDIFFSYRKKSEPIDNVRITVHPLIKYAKKGECTVTLNKNGSLVLEKIKIPCFDLFSFDPYYLSEFTGMDVNCVVAGERSPMEVFLTADTSCGHALLMPGLPWKRPKHEKKK